VELQGRVDDIKKNGMGLAVITYDPVPVLADFASRRRITFPLLSDEGSATIRRYGLLNTTVPESNASFGYPFPGTFLVDRKGVVTSRFFEQEYQERNTIASVLVRVGGRLDAPATKVSSPQAGIISYLTDSGGAPGTRFAVVLDITPGPKMHIYAPGVKGYKPLTLAIDPQPGLVIRETHYPASEEYYFQPLDERVPVFQKPFRIVHDLMIDPSRAGQAALSGRTTMAITGTLSYQACDDRLCYMPQTIPLKWSITLKPLDRERVKR
jgi:hypothetical protein